MADVSTKTVRAHVNKLDEIGIFEVKNTGVKSFKINSNDERALVLGLIEANKFLRKSHKL